MFKLILLFLILNIPLQLASFIHPKCFWKVKNIEYEVGKLGICGFLFYTVPWPLEIKDFFFFFFLFRDRVSLEANPIVLALAFTVDEVNRNPDLLPNMSLAFQYFPSQCDTISQLYSDIQSSVITDNPENYICNGNNMCTVVLSGPNWAKSLIFGKAMDLRYSQQVIQLTFGHFHPILSDQEQFPYLYQMAPKDTALALAMISLMIHFSWNWVGLAISDNDQGTQFLSDLRREMEQNTICFAFVNMIPVNMNLYMSRAEVYYNQIMTSSSNVVIIYGDTDSTLAESFRMWESLGIQRVWITTSQWDVIPSQSDLTLDSSHRTLAFAHHHTEISGFKNFLQTLSPLTPNEILPSLEWMKFNCEVSDSKCKTLMNCSSNASLEWLKVETFDMAFNDVNYDIYDAVYMVAHFFNMMLLQPVNNGKESQSNCLKLHSILRKTHFTYTVGDKVNMKQKEKLQAEYDIFQIWNLPNGLGLKVKIGKFSPYFPHGQQLYLYEDIIEWAAGSREMPPSVCSADCGPGFRKFWQEGMTVCCFDCNSCPENEITNETNVDQCMKCPEEQYANAEKNRCIPKSVVFLTYEDPLGMALILMSMCFTAFTTVVLGVFVKHHDTPIVKANNRSLSYTLIISLLFCFLCPLLFIGQPNAAKCILQQITFGVVFTVAISTVLAKTVTVVLAFKVTAPGRRIRFYLTLGAPNSIIGICTLIQIILCAIWLGISPPSIDIDVHSEHGQIIIVCDKGSVTAFYCVLGYHGSLAFGSFIVAFLARNLPDTFNKAKLLTFSMLLFCSVWVTFLPVYHSTKGKVMVAVEVFSILASSVGLLGCIFVPKCYIILLRPERNSLQKLKEKISF
ncbi:vomeronasal type-2 receptor 116-like isoform X1 [Peromyscus californicus insignis]|uniref:vomeronasal type-2 receptor 116-like isoform X1 n=1 Tax=Peromyscus californicus insignis TaxID=564181 RepID=UPI0022A7A369|nr:vomeronasal type-2 receptor 116-like isoform X1 [Peromyscus californicus insignis]